MHRFARLRKKAPLMVRSFEPPQDRLTTSGITSRSIDDLSASGVAGFPKGVFPQSVAEEKAIKPVAIFAALVRVKI
jgi:hypothetical protein